MLRIVIPARMGSTRLPDKMIQMLGGKMVVEHSIARVLDAAGEHEVWLATDSDIIFGAAFGKCHAVMTSANCRSGTDRCAEVADQLGWSSSDIIVNVQADMPFINPHHLRGFLDSAAKGGDWEVFTAVYDHRYVEVSINDFDRRVAPSHIGLYAYTRDALRRFAALPTAAAEQSLGLEQMRAVIGRFKFGYHAFPEMPMEVNTRQDLAALQWVATCLGVAA